MLRKLSALKVKNKPIFQLAQLNKRPNKEQEKIARNKCRNKLKLQKKFSTYIHKYIMAFLGSSNVEISNDQTSKTETSKNCNRFN